MKTSPLADTYRRDGQPVQEYCGSLTAVGAPAANAPPVALYDASWRAALQVEGPEARKWLNGMISANVRDLAPGRLLPSFQLDPKGHILATLDVACTAPDRFLLWTDESQREELLQRLRRFVFIAKLTLEDRSERESALLLRGPEWENAWRRAGLPPFELRPGECAGIPVATLAGEATEVLAAVSAPGGVAQLELWAAPAAVRSLFAHLAVYATVSGSAAFERDRIVSRIPRYGVDMSSGDLPQETGQADRLDFTKGCYIGQEIVERVRARGAVHRHWSALRLEAAVEPGAALRVEEREVGKLTSVAPRDGGWVGLGYIRDPHAAPGAKLQAGAVTAWVED